MEKNKFAYFNLLKFLGSICIACFLHYNDHLMLLIDGINPFKEGSLLRYISTNSYVFVEMFFLISGILFGLVYIKRIIKGEKFSDFILKRYYRIYPLVIISMVFMYFSNYIYFRKFASFFSCGRLSLSNLFFDLVFSGKTIFDGSTPINGPLWYISPLILCYILGYFLVKKYKDKKYVFFVPIIIGLFVINSGLNFFIFNPTVARGIISFFTGIILYIFVFNKKDKFSKTFSIISKVICVIVLILFVMCIFNQNYNLYFDSYYNTIIAFTYFFFVPLFYLLYDVRIIEKICSSKIVTFLGNISYSIYVWNFPILIIVTYIIKSDCIKVNIKSAWFFIILIAIHIIVGTLSYYVIEKKIKIFLNNYQAKSNRQIKKEV